MDDNVFVEAEEIAWKAEVNAITEKAWAEVNRLRALGSPETARAIDILSFVMGLGAWSPQSEVNMRPYVKESEITSFKESALLSLNKLKEMLESPEP